MLVFYKRFVGIVSVILVLSFIFACVVSAVDTTFRITITSDSLGVSIVDASGDPVVTPAVSFTSYTRSSDCAEATGTLGTSAERIRINNPGDSDTGWRLNIAASATTALWVGGTATNTFDYNDPGGASEEGCIDETGGGSDADSVGGQLSIDPSASTLAGVASASTANISKGSSADFDEGSVDSINLLDAAAGSVDFGVWELTGVSLVQKVPASQAADTYSLTMSITVVAQ